MQHLIDPAQLERLATRLREQADGSQAIADAYHRQGRDDTAEPFEAAADAYRGVLDDLEALAPWLRPEPIEAAAVA